MCVINRIIALTTDIHTLHIARLDGERGGGARLDDVGLGALLSKELRRMVLLLDSASIFMDVLLEGFLFESSYKEHIVITLLLLTITINATQEFNDRPVFLQTYAQKSSSSHGQLAHLPFASVAT